ncbi:hypothetical protein ORJ66_00825 [Pseudoalteromonas tunicata]|uniref:hypothetical protein n=1 Tax=Pseudoalteromonas tunicata TaxID=314281 RepID=UPI00273EDB29|nr:hypothetical protein [Pseudoalteromonas tunicata]MDP5211588.1 hypothetical protein [Pseudoalteromonas tunicata]
MQYIISPSDNLQNWFNLNNHSISEPFIIEAQLPQIQSQTEFMWHCELIPHCSNFAHHSIIAIEPHSQYVLFLTIKGALTARSLAEQLIKDWQQELWWLILYENILTDEGHKIFRNSITRQALTISYTFAANSEIEATLHEANYQLTQMLEFSEKEILSKDQKLELTFILNQSRKAYIKSGAVISFYPAVRLLDHALAEFYTQTEQQQGVLFNSQILEKQPFEVDKDNIIALQDYLLDKKLSQG